MTKGRGTRSGGDAGGLPGAADLDRWLQETDELLAAGDSEGPDRALAYLEADPFYFRSGYARTRLARRLARADMSAAQQARARTVVVRCVDGEWHCGQVGVGPLAHAVADNPLRRALRLRLHGGDEHVVRRAVRTILWVPHPGLSVEELAVARELVLRDAGRGNWLSPTVERVARRLWAPGWEAELRALQQHHDPLRAGAKRLTESRDRSRARRPGP